MFKFHQGIYSKLLRNYTNIIPINNKDISNMLINFLRNEMNMQMALFVIQGYRACRHDKSMFQISYNKYSL